MPLGRPDPFFINRDKPHTNGYLESLHRTYGEPAGALPKRDDVLFQRAYQFRKQEKEHYTRLEEEHKALQRRYQELSAETATIQTLVEQLSKAPIKDVVESDPGSGANSSIGVQQSIQGRDTDTRRSDERVVEHSEAGGRRRNRKLPVRVAEPQQDPGNDGGRGGDLPDEVLRAGDGAVGGPTAEHSVEGPEPEGGVGSAKDASGPPGGGEEATE